jgi:ketosteroid isomerase-like protein
MTTETTSGFDLGALRQAVESRDAAAQAAMFADDAEVVFVDRDHGPSEPQRFRGRDEIRAMLEDTCSRDMTHQVEHAIASGDEAAFTVACQYADGTRVLCAATLELRDGQIARQIGVQAWDQA